ncbi:MAG: CopG family ribbon-helix-helix protein [Burkholderiales bacterium]
MTNTTTITVRLDAKTKQRLEKLARNQDRTKSYLAGRAIEDYLSSQEWWEQKIAAARRSRELSDEEVDQMFRKLEGREDHLARKRKPRSRRNR